MKTTKNRSKELRREFAGRLRELRRLRGYPTAYRFYHSAERGDGLGVSFQQYLRIEKGERLPSVETLKVILKYLGQSSPLYAERDALVRLYVEATMGGDPLFDNVFAAPAPRATVSDPDAALTELALKQRFAAIPDMTAAQSESILSDPHRFWFFEWLLASGKTVTVTEAAVQFGTSELDAASALDALVAEGLLVRKKRGYVSPHHATDLGQPQGALTGARVRWIQSLITDRLKKGGAKLVYGYHFMTVEGVARVQQAISMMRKTAHQTYLLRENLECRDPRLVCVEFRVSDIEAIPEQKR